MCVKNKSYKNDVKITNLQGKNAKRLKFSNNIPKIQQTKAEKVKSEIEIHVAKYIIHDTEKLNE